MSPPAKTILKPKLSEALLQEHGIYFYESVHGDDELDDWILPIREQLIRLRTPLPEKDKELFTKEFEAFLISGQDREEAYQDSWSLEPSNTEGETVYYSPKGYEKVPSLKKIKNEIITCTEGRNQAHRWCERNEKEHRWMAFLQNYFFKPFHEVHVDADFHENTLQRWELHGDVHWNEFPQWTNMNPAIRRRTGPKPDLTYAFPIIDTTDKVNFRYLHDSLVESFSLTVLNTLRNKKEGRVISSPTTKLSRWAPTKSQSMDSTSLMCFPWAIVEVKKNKESIMSGAIHDKHNARIARANKAIEQFCYCQAANASAEALKLRENLCAEANDPSESRDALVIFSFTCVGPSVKLWVTYRENPHAGSSQENPAIMSCIWATSLQLTWGVMALRMVIKNMREWVYARVRPELSRWISMVHNRPLRQMLLTPGGDTVVRARRAKSCEPLCERPAISLFGSPHRILPPALSRGETVPETSGRRRVTLAGHVEQQMYNSEGEGDSEASDNESEPDEGYASDHTYEDQSEEDSESDDDDDEEEEEGVTEDESNEEDEGSDEEEFEEEDNDDQEDDQSDEAGYYAETQRSQALRLKSITKSSPAKHGRSKKDQSPHLRLRRRSSHF